MLIMCRCLYILCHQAGRLLRCTYAWCAWSINSPRQRRKAGWTYRNQVMTQDLGDGWVRMKMHYRFCHGVIKAINNVCTFWKKSCFPQLVLWLRQQHGRWPCSASVVRPGCDLQMQNKAAWKVEGYPLHHDPIPFAKCIYDLVVVRSHQVLVSLWYPESNIIMQRQDKRVFMQSFLRQTHLELRSQIPGWRILRCDPRVCLVIHLDHISWSCIPDRLSYRSRSINMRISRWCLTKTCAVSYWFRVCCCDFGTEWGRTKRACNGRSRSCRYRNVTLLALCSWSKRTIWTSRTPGVGWMQTMSIMLCVGPRCVFAKLLLCH